MQKIPSHLNKAGQAGKSPFPSSQEGETIGSFVGKSSLSSCQRGGFTPRDNAGCLLS